MNACACVECPLGETLLDVLRMERRGDTYSGSHDLQRAAGHQQLVKGQLRALHDGRLF